MASSTSAPSKRRKRDVLSVYVRHDRFTQTAQKPLSFQHELSVYRTMTVKTLLSNLAVLGGQLQELWFLERDPKKITTKSWTRLKVSGTQIDCEKDRNKRLERLSPHIVVLFAEVVQEWGEFFTVRPTRARTQSSGATSVSSAGSCVDDDSVAVVESLRERLASGPLRLRHSRILSTSELDSIDWGDECDDAALPASASGGGEELRRTTR